MYCGCIKLIMGNARLHHKCTYVCTLYIHRLKPFSNRKAKDVVMLTPHTSHHTSYTSQSLSRNRFADWHSEAIIPINKNPRFYTPAAVSTLAVPRGPADGSVNTAPPTERPVCSPRRVRRHDRARPVKFRRHSAKFACDRRKLD